MSRIRDSDTPKEELDELSRDIEDIDASIFATKRQISQAGRTHSESAGSRAGRTHHSSSPSTRSTGSNSSSTKKKAAIVGLEAKRKAMLETQKAKANLADIQAELELETAKLINEAQQKLELSKIDEEIAKAKAVETVYMKEEEAALPTRSCGSNISRVSMRSSIVQKAKIAE